MSKNNLFIALVLTILSLSVFQSWFFTHALVGGDLGYIFKEQFSSFPFFPPAWQSIFNLGYANYSLLWTGVLLHFYINTLGKFMDYTMITLLGFFIPFLIIGIFSSILLLKKVVTHNPWFLLFGTIIYLFNTYILMLVGGGQIAIALAYALAPLVLVTFMKLIEEVTLRKAILAGVLLSIQVIFDPRIVYITLLIIFFYFLFQKITLFSKKRIRELLLLILYVFIIPLGIVGLLNAFWVLPVVMVGGSPIAEQGSGFSTAEAVKFFSFAKFENTISLLHPHWPENIFGKVGFMKAEFLLLPLLAYCALFFISKKQKIILFFALLGLLGAFLAKGANEPFGFVYLWLFEHVPGFMMFRDPTKFYLLIALSYSVLIPFTLLQIIHKYNKVLSFGFMIVVFFYLLLLLHPALLGHLRGTFKPNAVQVEYSQLTQFLHNQTQFSRTLWIPQIQRFGYYSANHPAINGREFLQVNSLEDIIKRLQKPDAKQLLQESGVKYIIVPFDSEGELFLDDRKYSEKQYRFIRDKLRTIPWLTHEKNFGKIVVFEITGGKDHFWFGDKSDKVQWKKINDTHYQIFLNKQEKEKIIFSESYHPGWLAITNGTKIASERFHDRYNSFSISEKTSQVDIYFEPQEWVNKSVWISVIAAIICGALLFRYR